MYMMFFPPQKMSSTLQSFRVFLFLVAEAQTHPENVLT